MGLHGVALVPPCGTTWCSPSPPMWDYMVYPLSSGAVTKSVYFPKAHWYDLHTLAMVTPGGTTKVVAAPVDFIPVSVLLCPCAMTTTQPPPPPPQVYLRGGSVVPAQESANTTTVAKTTDYSLLIALDNQGLASGDLYIDDGFSLNPST